MAAKSAPSGIVGQNIVSYWKGEIDSARTRQKKFTEQARRIELIYEAEAQKENAFNILYSNTETLLPALFSQAPRPVVTRRFKDENKLARIAGKALERALAYHLDSPDPEYETFDGAMENVVLGALVPGLGLNRAKYDVEFEPEQKDGEEKEKSINKEGDQDDSGDENDPVDDPTPPPDAEKVKYETACTEIVPWDKVLFGPGRRWVDLPWVGFIHSMTKYDARRAFGKTVADKLSYAYIDSDRKDQDKPEATKANDHRGTVEVVEIWHKTTGKVWFIAPTYNDGPLKAALDDPLHLQGFYPCPEPLILFSRVKSFIPRQLYLFYEAQAKELNRITIRINKLVDALKVRGFYGAGLNGLQDLLSKEENTLVPAQNQGMMQDGQNLNNWIWLVPIEKIAQVVQQLYIQREQVKRVIYEVTGISDIIRGSTVASETATAQNIKNQWGTQRLKKMQKRVQRYVRDYLRLVAEVMCKHYGPETWATMTGVQLPKPEEKEQAQQLMAMAQQQPQQPQQPGQPPAPPPVPEAQMAKAQETLSMPTWDDILAFLKNDLLRNYNIDIETNSTIEPDSVEDQEQIAKLLGGVSNMFSSLGPAVEKGALPMAGFKAMLLAVTRRFRFGEEVEDILMQIPDQMPPPAQDQGKEAETKAKIELTQAETAGKIKVMDKEVQVKEKELELKMRELALKEKELAIKENELGVKQQASQIKSQGIIAAAHAKTRAAQIAAAAPQPQPQAPQGANPGQVPAGAGAPANAPV